MNFHKKLHEVLQVHQKRTVNGIPEEDFLKKRTKIIESIDTHDHPYEFYYSRAKADINSLMLLLVADNQRVFHIYFANIIEQDTITPHLSVNGHRIFQMKENHILQDLLLSDLERYYMDMLYVERNTKEGDIKLYLKYTKK